MKASSQKQLNVRSDEARQRASAIAKRLGKTRTEVIVEALRNYDAETIPRDAQGLTPEQRQRHEAFMAFVRDLQQDVIPGSTSEHDDLYDEFGLPK